MQKTFDTTNHILDTNIRWTMSFNLPKSSRFVFDSCVNNLRPMTLNVRFLNLHKVLMLRKH